MASTKMVHADDPGTHNASDDADRTAPQHFGLMQFARGRAFKVGQDVDQPAEGVAHMEPSNAPGLVDRTILDGATRH